MIPIERRFEGYYRCYVRCGEEMYVDYDHPSLAEKYWNVKRSDYGSDMREAFFNQFGELEIDMGVIILRNGKRIEFGGRSESMRIPQTPEIREIVRPITRDIIVEAHPGFVVCHIPDLARPRFY